MGKVHLVTSLSLTLTLGSSYVSQYPGLQNETQSSVSDESQHECFSLTSYDLGLFKSKSESRNYRGRGGLFECFFNNNSSNGNKFFSSRNIPSTIYLKCIEPFSGSYEFSPSFRERCIEITADQGYNTIRFNGELHKQQVSLCGSSHQRTVEISNTKAPFIVDINNSEGGRKIYLHNARGQNIICVHQSRIRRLITIKSQSGRLNEYRIEPGKKVRIYTGGQNRDYVIEISGTKDVVAFGNAPEALRKIKLP